jgi:hypothetical protein
MKKQKKRDQKSFKKQMKKTKSQPMGTLLQSSSRKKHILHELKNEFDKLDGSLYVNNETITNSTDLRYIISTSNIPEDIRPKVKNLITAKKPKIGQCMWYSRFICSQIPEVNQIFGMFQIDEFQIISSYLPTNQITCFDNTLYYKDAKGKVWGLHSWNEYKGVHFDCMKDSIYDKYEDKQFIKYMIVKKEEVRIKPQLSKFLNYDYEFISSSI